MDVSSPELDLFTKPQLQTDVADSGVVTYEPLSHVEGISGPIEFNVPASDQHFLDPASIFLKIRARPQQLDGTLDPPKTADLTLPKNGMNSLFSGCAVFLNETKVDDGVNYSYRCLYENALANPSTAKRSVLSSSGKLLR